MNIYCIKSDFKEIFWNLQHMTEVTRGSCWHQNFIPKELSAPSMGIYTCIKSWKKLYKIIQRVFFLKLVANDLSDKRFLLTSKFCPLVPWGCLPLICGCTHLLNYEKMCIKSELKRFFLNLQQMTIVMRPSCWHKIFGPNGLCAPYPKAMFKLLSLNNCWV